ncbi:MAG TPA: hypothetical protein VMI94_01270 [Bryobacteraceae bacterium]|nr:hypothetical protein [Bryobacteraceae bacterium]
MENEAPDAVDRMMAEALAQYANAEPLAGLEQRVWQRIRARRRWRLYAWWALPVAAGLVLMAAPWLRTAPQELALRVAAPRPPQIAMVQAAARPPLRPARVLPRRRVFPTPAPLTRDERALLAFVAREPGQAREFMMRKDEPLRIEKLKIAPLDSTESK